MSQPLDMILRGGRVIDPALDRDMIADVAIAGGKIVEVAASIPAGTVREVIDSVRRVTGRPIAVEECARREGDPAVLVAGSEKIKRELGWRPQFAGLDTIIASAWEWHQRRYS